MPLISSSRRPEGSAGSPNLVESPPITGEEVDTDFQGPSEKKSDLALPSVALFCDRPLVSDRTAAMIASTTLKDDFISGPDKILVPDKNKIRLTRKKSHNQNIASQFFYML